MNSHDNPTAILHRMQPGFDSAVSGRSDFKARFVALGASNLTRAISTVVQCARVAAGGPVEVLAALGHGRSFGMHSSVLGRKYPSILSCGIWDALEQSVSARPELPTYALITDIGNDIMYGAQPTVIDRWVEQCIERLQHFPSTRVTMTRLPIHSIKSIRPWQFAIVKTAFFPTRKLKFTDAVQRGTDLHELVNDLGDRRQVQLVDLPREWYGFDPIHIRMRHWKHAWSSLVSASFRDQASEALPRHARGSLRQWLHLKLMRPEAIWWFGVPLRKNQPGGQLPDGTMVSLF